MSDKQYWHRAMAYPELLWGLPVVAVATVWVYARVNPLFNQGLNATLHQIQSPQRALSSPLYGVPLLMVASLASHGVGASVGREGTGVQLGALVAGFCSDVLGIAACHRPGLLMAGMSAGFAGIFGMPLAGTVFGLEVVGLLILPYRAVLPCALAAFVAYATGYGWGIAHTAYTVTAVPTWSWLLLAQLIGCGMVLGAAARAFLAGLAGIRYVAARCCPKVAGQGALLGSLILLLALGLTPRYLGLGLPELAEAFTEPSSVGHPVGKALFTALSLAAGFKGGEVTPLFYVGAHLGNLLALWVDWPLSFGAALGFCVLLGAATHTPLAGIVLAVELFGIQFALPALIMQCFAYSMMGQRSVYSAQTLGLRKFKRYYDLHYIP